MTKARFIHTSDLHLDTPFRGLLNRNPQQGLKYREATVRSFIRIIDLCIEHQVDFLVIAGDVFDSENKSVASQRRFAVELERLKKHGIQVFLVCGNHDPLSEWLTANKLPDNVHRFDSSSVERIPFERDGVGIVDIYGTSFENKVVRENLSLKYEIGDKPLPISIAVLHGTIGAAGPHETYAPFKLDDIAGKGFDYWALGHIHKRQIISSADPAVVYSGNPQGRDFGETGQKGCYLVEINAGNAPELTFLPTQLIRFEEVDVDLSGEDDFGRLSSLGDELIENVPDYDGSADYVFRVVLKGRTSLHSHLKKPGELQALLEDLNSDHAGGDLSCWIDRFELRTSPEIDLEGLRKGADFLGEVLRTLDETAVDNEVQSKFLSALSEDFKSVPARRDLSELTASDMESLFVDAQQRLIDLLAGDGK